jgi:geranylgeranyl diphosphate synthase, type II
MLEDITSALSIIEDELKKLDIPEQPANLYNPVRYILSNGGKRIRPSLTLLACNLFDNDYSKAIYPALGIEVFHNFTLLHDDLMDKSPVRRNDPTVHIKWNPNIAILSGDAMSILASQLISKADKDVMPGIMSIFTKTALEVCEGQMMDMDFETRTDVKVDEYIRMIGLKTSVLIAASIEIGAIAGGADKKTASDLYEFGYNLGIAFQLQDDLLDTFGDISKFGKKIGSDILNNKKTFLYLKALELSANAQRKKLEDLYTTDGNDPNDKISLVKNIFESLEIERHTKEHVSFYFSSASEIFDSIKIPDSRKSALRKFVQELMHRDF